MPTVLPAFDATLTPQQLQFASVHNGFLMKDTTGAWLGGAQGFTVTWSGALLIEQDGTYEFWAGAPTPGEDRPDAEAAGAPPMAGDAPPRTAQLGDPQPPLGRGGRAPGRGAAAASAAPTS